MSHWTIKRKIELTRPESLSIPGMPIARKSWVYETSLLSNLRCQMLSICAGKLVGIIEFWEKRLSGLSNEIRFKRMTNIVD